MKLHSRKFHAYVSTQRLPRPFQKSNFTNHRRRCEEQLCAIFFLARARMITRRILRSCSRKYRSAPKKARRTESRDGKRRGEARVPWSRLHAKLHARPSPLGGCSRLIPPIASPLTDEWWEARRADWPRTGSRGRTRINYSK